MPWYTCIVSPSSKGKDLWQGSLLSSHVHFHSAQIESETRRRCAWALRLSCIVAPKTYNSFLNINQRLSVQAPAAVGSRNTKNKNKSWICTVPVVCPAGTDEVVKIKFVVPLKVSSNDLEFRKTSRKSTETHDGGYCRL